MGSMEPMISTEGREGREGREDGNCGVPFQGEAVVGVWFRGRMPSATMGKPFGLIYGTEGIMGSMGKMSEMNC